jgi:signal transduction histidine kinase
MTAIVAVDLQLSTQADRRLKGAVIELGGELDEDQGHLQRERLERELRDENEEIAASGIELAVFDGRAKLAGLGPSRRPHPGKCKTTGVLGTRVRSCAIAYDDWVLVASQPTDTEGLRWIYLLAAFGACVVGAAMGGVLGFRGARWAVRPLAVFTDALRKLRPEVPPTGPLATTNACEEVEQLRVAMIGLIARIHELLAQAQRFAADAAHELRTPLTALCAELELTAESLPIADRVGLERARAKALRLSGLIERLLLLALPRERLSDGFEPLSLDDVVRDIIATLPAGSRELVEFDSDGEGLLRGDEQLLATLVRNALENALKFGTGSRVFVKLSQREPSFDNHDPWLRLEVSDRGPGIEDALRAKVFEPFYRIERNGAQGYGLGLALIGHVARVHGGQAAFVDCEQGAHLVIDLPGWSTATR